MKLYLVRHGETDWNIENKIQGQTDIALNEKGRQQARDLAGDLAGGERGIKVIYTSRQKRAWQTAEIIGEIIGAVPKAANGLEEINMGKWEGYTWKQVKEVFSEDYQLWQKNRRYQMPPMGESYQQLLDRLLPAINAIIKKEVQNTLIVTHSGVIMTLMSYVYDTPFEDMARNYKMGNAKIAELDKELFYTRYSVTI